MKHTAKLLLNFVKDNIILMREIKLKKPYLYIFVKNNFFKIREYLKKQHNVCLIDDIRIHTDLENVKNYYNYYHNGEVNLSKLYKTNTVLYIRMREKFGNLYKAFSRIGLKVTYDKILSEEELKQIIEQHIENGIIYLQKPLYDKIYIRAMYKKMNPREYLDYLGFKNFPYKYISKEGRHDTSGGSDGER